MPLQAQGIVLRNNKIQSVYFLLEIDCPPIATLIQPGQFVMLKIHGSQTPLLRRPFSLFKKDLVRHRQKQEQGRFSILYKIVGRGTQKMTELAKGAKVDIIGPLGNGFNPPPLSIRNAILIGGGVGIVSLFPLAEALEAGKKLSVFIGGKTKTDILCVKNFKKQQNSIPLFPFGNRLPTHCYPHSTRSICDAENSWQSDPPLEKAIQSLQKGSRAISSERKPGAVLHPIQNRRQRDPKNDRTAKGRRSRSHRPIGKRFYLSPPSFSQKSHFDWRGSGDRLSLPFSRSIGGREKAFCLYWREDKNRYFMRERFQEIRRKHLCCY